LKIDTLAVALPEVVVTNDELSHKFPKWDFQRLENRTGVFSRHIVGNNETAFDLAVRASEKVFESSKIDRNEVGAVLYCTQTPDHPVPGDAARLQDSLKLSDDKFVLDINSGCSSFPYLLHIAEGLFRTDTTHCVLVVTSDTYSRKIHQEDRSTRVLFGDGAAATLLRPSKDNFLPIFGSRGDLFDRFWVKNGGAKYPIDTSLDTSKDSFIHMEGLKILSFFNSEIPKLVLNVCQKNKKKLDQIDAFVFHQASGTALDFIQQALEIPDSKMIRSYQKTGNLVSASIPAALKYAKDSNQIGEGDLIMLCGFGVGLSWGATLFKL
jgi:3-oxoacyl-[acyl-carrier-protein] synthase III